ncbi:MAG TPA: NUDIX domain-containing protein [Patescibacteria group bacterium]|jgi:8-oxo-dGTP pyrophosphatase MutT (NUDIX family)
MTLTDTVKFLQKAAIIHEGKVLILKRLKNAQYRPGAWDLPGGNAEWPTSGQNLTDQHAQEVAREIEEETGISVKPTNFTDENLVHFTTYFEANRPLYSLICGWRVELIDQDPNAIVLSDEHTEWAWISPTELDAYDFGEPVGTYVKTIIRNAFKKE